MWGTFKLLKHPVAENQNRIKHLVFGLVRGGKPRLGNFVKVWLVGWWRGVEPWYFNKMVTQNMLQANAGNLILSETKKIRFVTALDIIKCHKQIE